MTLNRTLFLVEVSETDRNRNYWATRTSTESASKIRRADLVIVPWENFRSENPTLFPQGSADIFRALKAALPETTIAIGVDQPNYQEIAIHSNEFRLPTLLVTAILLPAVAQILANRIDQWVPGFASATTIEMEVIVENPQGRCIQVKYRGPKGELADNILKQTERCLPKGTTDDTKPEPQTAR